MNREYEAGFSAYFQGKSPKDNPYMYNKVGEQYSWWKGWLDAEYRCYFKYIASANYIVSGYFGHIVSK